MIRQIRAFCLYIARSLQKRSTTSKFRCLACTGKRPSEKHGMTSNNNKHRVIVFLSLEQFFATAQKFRTSGDSNWLEKQTPSRPYSKFRSFLPVSAENTLNSFWFLFQTHPPQSQPLEPGTIWNKSSFSNFAIERQSIYLSEITFFIEFAYKVHQLGTARISKESVIVGTI